MSRGNTYSLPRDANRVPVTGGVSTTDGITTLPIEVDPVTGQLQTSASVTGNVTVDNLANDMFGANVTATRYNQIEIDYAGVDPDVITDITVTKTNGGDASTANGQAVYTTGANTSGGIKAVTNKTVTYRPHNESYAAFTAIFTTGIANSYQRIGIYDTDNGFFIGYEGTSFGLSIRSSTVDTRVARASWNVDTLTGGATSKYTRNGTPEALDPTKDNLYRIRFGWLGASAVYFEVLSPDQEWVVFHKYLVANTSTIPSIANPNLPITLDAQKSTAGATVLTMNTACWAGGTSSNNIKITDTITDNTLAPLTRSVITGYSSAGGGSYNNVKVTPSGSLTVAVGDITGIVGQQTMANSIPVVIASNQTQVPIGDGTNVPAVLAGDTGQNGLTVVGSRKEVTFTTTTAQAVGTTDVSNYKSVSVQITSQGTSSTVTFQGSNDNTNWVAVSLQAVQNVGSTQPATSTTATSTILFGSLNYRYFRLNVTGISAGTTAGIIEFFTMPASPFTTPINVLSSTPATPTSNYLTAAATTNATSVKGSAGNVYSISLTNYSAAAKYFKLYNKATAPVVGTDVPILTIEVAANSYRDLQCGALGLRFTTGIAFAMTGAQADSDTTALAAGDMKSVISYI